MLLAGTPLAARQAQRNLARACGRRDRQLDGPNAPGRAASEERFAGRGPFLTLRRCEGDGAICTTEISDRVMLARIVADSLVISNSTRMRLTPMVLT